MSDKKNPQRLDEILIAEGAITDEQIRQALKSQKEHGGRFGSHLLKLGFVDEATLVAALSRQQGCQGVVLSEQDISEVVIKLIPARIALARKVLPFDYDPEANVLKVACDDPNDRHLMDELRFVARGKGVRLYVAAETVLKEGLEKFYKLPEKTSKTRLEELRPDTAPVEAVESVEEECEPIDPGSTDNIGWVLLVTNDEDESAWLKSVFEERQYGVATTGSADDAIELSRDRQFDTVFIKDTIQGDYIDLIDRLRKNSPRTSVEYYGSLAALMLDSGVSSEHCDLVTGSLELLTSLLVSKKKLDRNHSAAVGRYANRLCRRLGLPDKDRIAITSAGYLHDLAVYHYDEPDVPDNPRDLAELTARHLDSLNYSPLVVGILKKMYIDLGGKYTRRLPIEALGGNILTAVDIFCDSVDPDEKLTLDQFELLKKKFEELSGRLFMPEVAGVFIELIQDEMLAEQPVEKFSQVLILVNDTSRLEPLEKRLRGEGFQTTAETSLEEFGHLYMRGKPDLMILLGESKERPIEQEISRLIADGVEIPKVPTFLLTDATGTALLSPMLEKGIEDIIPIDDNLNLLVAKMKRLRSRIEAEESKAITVNGDSGSHGSLEDMSLIDLLQALGPSRKTVKMTVSSETGSTELYLDRGSLIYARLDEREGADAVYETMSWTHGSWTMQPVEQDQLPTPNNELPNETIMMEGCRLLDEKNRPHPDTQRIQQV